MTNWMTAAGFALIAGGLAALVCFRTVLFGAGGRRARRAARVVAAPPPVPSEADAPVAVEAIKATEVAVDEVAVDEAAGDEVAGDEVVPAQDGGLAEILAAYDELLTVDRYPLTRLAAPERDRVPAAAAEPAGEYWTPISAYEPATGFDLGRRRPSPRPRPDDPDGPGEPTVVYVSRHAADPAR